MEALLMRSRRGQQQDGGTSSSSAASVSGGPSHTLWPRDTEVVREQFQQQFHPSYVPPSFFSSQTEKQNTMMEEAFSLPMFANNRICPWCSAFCKEDHIARCEKKVIACPICKTYILAVDGVQHYQECQEMVLRIATDRVVAKIQERRRQEEEEADRRRVQLLQMQAEADAAALRQRASSLVTKKQSIGNLLFSGVSIGDEGIESKSEGGKGEQLPSKRSVVRIKSEPEMSNAPANQGSMYNRVASFFTKTNDSEAAPQPEVSQPLKPSAVRHSIAGPVLESEEGSEVGGPTNTDRARTASSANIPAFTQSAASQARRQTIGVMQTAQKSSPTATRKLSPPTSLPPPLQLQQNQTASPRGSMSPKMHRAATTGAGVMSLASAGSVLRGPSVDSTARAPSTTSSSAIVNGLKRCKWCGQQAAVEHEKKCASRIVMCKKCNSMIKMKDKEDHIKICAAVRGETPAQ